MEWLSLVGATSGIVAVATLIYGFGVKFSKLDLKVGLLWKVVIEDALRGQVDRGWLAHASPYQLTDGSLDFVDTIAKPQLTKLLKCKYKNDVELTQQVIKTFGMDYILKESASLEIPVKDYIALCVGAVHSLETKKTK